MADHFVIIVYGYKDCSPLGTVGGTITDCERAIRWQGQGGFDMSHYHVCQPVPGQRGTFASIKTGAHFPTNRGALTEAAYAALCDHLWPETATSSHVWRV